MGFFDLFKRKKSVEPKVESVETPAVEPAPVVEEPKTEEQPVADVVAEEPKVAEPVPTVVESEPEPTPVPEPEPAPEEEYEVVDVEAERKELEEGLGKTKEGFFGRLKRAIAGRSTVDADVLDELEEVLIT